MSHTPLPWKWDGYDLWHIGESYDSATDPHRYTGITSDRRCDGSSAFTANRCLVLRAVNCHDELLAACEAAVSEAIERDEDMGCNCWPQLIAAIAKAKKEGQ